MEIIVFEKESYWKHMQYVIEKLGNKNAEQLKKIIDNLDQNKSEPRWIDQKQAMALLNIRSKTTLWHLRCNGAIVYSQIGKKSILYCRESIMRFIESKIQDTF